MSDLPHGQLFESWEECRSTTAHPGNRVTHSLFDIGKIEHITSYRRGIFTLQRPEFPYQVDITYTDPHVVRIPVTEKCETTYNELKNTVSQTTMQDVERSNTVHGLLYLSGKDADDFVSRVQEKARVLKKCVMSKTEYLMQMHAIE